jgi:hypothetical protein
LRSAAADGCRALSRWSSAARCWLATLQTVEERVQVVVEWLHLVEVAGYAPRQAVMSQRPDPNGDSLFALQDRARRPVADPTCDAGENEATSFTLSVGVRSGFRTTTPSAATHNPARATRRATQRPPAPGTPGTRAKPMTLQTVLCHRLFDVSGQSPRLSIRFAKQCEGRTDRPHCRARCGAGCRAGSLRVRDPARSECRCRRRSRQARATTSAAARRTRRPPNQARDAFSGSIA